MDVAHIATPAVLVDALGQSGEDGLLSDEGPANMLRWHAVGLDLCRTPYDGTDEERKIAVAGWVIPLPRWRP
jgi:hypothetical protein